MKLKQTDKILRHLHDYGTINPIEALNEYGIMRLASRICDLKDMGYNIETTATKSINRYGEPVWYATYKLEEVNHG